jgi:hypothetical protein
MGDIPTTGDKSLQEVLTPCVEMPYIWKSTGVRKMARKIFEWSALLTWIMILSGALTYVTAAYVFNVIDHPQEQRIEKMPDRFPAGLRRV